VSMHIRDKKALFAEIARVLRPGGLFVMHEQTAPIPEVMRPITRQAPYIAPSLPQLIRYVDGSGLRVLTWRDTTARVVEYFEGMRAALEKAPLPPRGDPGRAMREHGSAVVHGYIEALANLGGRTGILAARRVDPEPGRRLRRTH
jgi:SAM-dependent methyltransferase